MRSHGGQILATLQQWNVDSVNSRWNMVFYGVEITTQLVLLSSVMREYFMFWLNTAIKKFILVPDGHLDILEM